MKQKGGWTMRGERRLVRCGLCVRRSEVADGQ